MPRHIIIAVTSLAHEAVCIENLTGDQNRCPISKRGPSLVDCIINTYGFDFR